MRLYSNIRKLLPQSARGNLTKFIVQTGFKPTYNKSTESLFNKGIVVFSADFEMAWAFRFSKTRHLEANAVGLEERRNIPLILSLCDNYAIPVTWATVGHLFLNQCRKGENESPHPEMPRPEFFKTRNWSFSTKDWYQHDPCSDFIRDPAWYGSDLIDKILASKTKHEIACHSFSHIDFTYNNCNKILADAELEACINVAKSKAVQLVSMVFPGGGLGNFESLKEKGFICYRKPMKFHIDLPYIDSNGLVAIPSSLGLDRDPYGWTKEFHLKMTRNFLLKAIEYNQVCHFWFHPSMKSWYIEYILPGLFEMVNEYRQAGKIDLLTMDQLAEEVIKNAN